MSGEMVGAIIIAVIGSQAFSLVVNALIEKFRKPSVLAQGMKLLLQDRIRCIALAALERGETTAEERKYISDCYEVYHELKGNGEMTRLIRDYDALPINYFKEA